MKKALISLGIITLALAACKQFKEGEGGLLYKIHTDISGENIKPGDFVALKVVQKTEGDSVIFSSYDFDRVSPVLVEKSQIRGDINYALTQLSEGDSATIKINIDSVTAVNKSGPPPPNFKGKYMIYTLKVVKVIPRGNLTDSAFQSKAQEYYKEDMEKAKTGEGAKIKNYIALKSLKPVVTSSGLNYVITSQGSGPKAVYGDTVLVNYTGYFISGKVFDTSILDAAKKAGTFDPGRTYQPIKVVSGMGGSIRGFEEALAIFPKGTKATIIMPSSLAYGAEGGPGPAYTPLIFEMEIVNIIHPKTVAELPPAIKK